MPAITVIKLRRGTAAEWTAANPVLAAGEEGHETNTGQRKVGNGSTAWNSLAYFASVDPAAVVLKSIVDAKGDLVAATAADTVARLAVGANGLVLTADSAAATGMAWAAAAGGMPVTGTQTTTTRKNIFELQPSTSGVGAFSAGAVATLFNSTYDYVFDFGYNPRRVVTTEPSFTFTIEHDYEPSPGVHALEAYFEYFSPNGAVSFRPLMWYINRSTNAMSATFKCETLQFQDIAGNNFMVAQPGQFTVSQFTGQDGVFRVGAATGRTSAFKMQNNAVDVVSISAAASYLIQWDIGEGAVFKNFMYMQTLGDVGVGTFLSIGSFDSKAVLTADTEGSGVSAKAIVARGKSGQTGSLFEAQDNAEAIMSRFDKNGYFMTRKVAAPADADLANSEGCIWWDPTPSTGGFRYKGKDSAGAILSGSL